MTKEETDRKNRETCRRISDEIDAIIKGEVLNDDGEEITLWDYFADALDIEYICNSRKEYKSARIMVGFGGPNIYIDTDTGNVELYWWTDRAHYALSTFAIEEIDAIMEEYFNCI